MVADDNTRSSETIDLEDGNWSNRKSQRTTKYLARRSCSNDSRWIILTALQMITIFVLVVRLHQRSVARGLQYR